MALEGITLGSSAGSGANAPAPSAAPAPTASSGALSGVSIKGVTAPTSSPSALSGVNIRGVSPPASPSNPIPTRNEYSTPAGPSLPTATDAATGQQSPTPFDPNIQSRVTMSEPLPAVPKGAKIGDTFTVDGKSYKVTGPSFQDLLSGLSGSKPGGTLSFTHTGVAPVPLTDTSTQAVPDDTTGSTLDFMKAVVSGVAGIPKGIYTAETAPTQEEKDLESQANLNDFQDPSKSAAERILATPFDILGRGMYRFFQPVLQGFANEVSVGIAGNSQAVRSKLGISMDDVMAMPGYKDTALQVIGNTAMAVLSAYTPSLFGDAADAASWGVKNAFIKGARSGAQVGFMFGSAQALASGSTDPGEITRDILISTIGFTILSALSHAAIPGGTAAVRALTKDVITEYKLPQTISVPASDVFDHLSGRQASQFIADLRLDTDQLKYGAKNGLTVEIPTETITTMTDKPWFKAIKGKLGIPEAEPQVTATGDEAPQGRATPAGLLNAPSEDVATYARITGATPEQQAEMPERSTPPPAVQETLERAKTNIAEPEQPAVPEPVSSAMEKARVAVQGSAGEAESMKAGPVSDTWQETPQLPGKSQKSSLYQGEGERYFVTGEKGAYHVDSQGTVMRSPETPDPSPSSKVGFGKAIPDKSLDLTQKLTPQEYTAFNTAYAHIQDKLEIPSENQRSLPAGMTGQEAFNHITGTSGLLGHENETAAQIVEILKRKGYKKFPKGFGLEEEKPLFKEGTIYNPDEKRIEEIKQNGGVVEYKKGGKIARIKQAIKGGAKSETYEGEKDLTTKVLQRLEGRDTVSKQFISDLTNAADLKQQERDIVREALSQYPDGKDVPVKDFADKVKAELLPLDREPVVKDTMRSGEQSLGGRYEFVSLHASERGSIENYSENVYTSPIETSAGDVHFSDASLGEKTGKDTRNYFGHTRIEDMADNSTRRIIEVQSDLYQKGNLEKEGKATAGRRINYRGKEYAVEGYTGDGNVNLSDAKTGETKLISEKVFNNLPENAGVEKLQQYSNPTAHFRMVREEVKQAAKDGKSTLLFPTGETAMKIEGLGQSEVWSSKPEGGPYKIDEAWVKDRGVGTTVYRGDEAWVITDVLGDGKFKAVQKSFAYTPENAPENMKETFDISDKVDTSNPVYRFYEKDLGRYLANKYGAKTFTDDKGVSWYKVDVKPEMAAAPVEAFKKGPQGSFKQSPDRIRQIIHSLIPEKDVSLVFKTDLIDGIATGKYSRSGDILNDKVKPLIELAEDKGKVSALDALHEAGHFIFDNYLSESEKRSMLDAAHEEMGILEKGKYRLNGYKGNDQVAQEYLMDQYAKQKASDMGFKGPLRRAMEAIDRIVRSIYEAFRKVKDYLSEIPNKEGGFFGVPDEEKARMDDLAAGAEKHVGENADALKAEYLEKHGNNFNVDKMKELIPGHSENRTMSEAFHKSAAKLMAELVDERLQGPGEGGQVVFTAGATAAGKTSAIEGLREGKDRLADAHAIIDGTLASDRSLKEIGKALKNGYEVVVKYVENSPERIFDNLVKRAEIDKDRTVPIETAYNSLFKSRQHLQRIAGKYADNPNFDVEVIDNSKDVPELIEDGVDFLKEHPYSTNDIEAMKAHAYQKLDTLKSDGKVSTQVYQGLIRRKADAPEGALDGDRSYHGEESGSGREGKEGQAKVEARPDEAADTATKQAHVSFNTDINRLVEDPSYDHLPNTVVNTKSAERLDALEERAQELALRKDALDQNPAKNLAKYASKRTGELPTVTGGEEAKSEFAKRGDDIVTEYGFKTPEEANEAVMKYLDNKKRFNEAVLGFMDEKRSLMEQFRADKDKYGDPTSHKPGNYDFEITENNKGVVPPEVRGGIQSPELDFSSWKDKMVPRLARDTMERNLEKVAPEKDAAKAKKFLIDPIRANELARVNFVNDLHEKIRAKMKELGIKRRTKLDRLVHIYAEEKINPLGLSRELDGDADRIKRVEAAVTYLRGIYANLLTDWNERRIEFGYQPIPERQNYMRHFTDINQFVNSFGFLRSESQLPTAIAGVSQHFKPGKPFTTAELRRTGDRTSYSAIGGMQNYLETVSKQMFHIDSIQRGRALERYLRDVAKQNPNLRLPNFAGNLSEWTNLVAGKASVLDRSIETGLLGRPVMKFLNTASRLLSSNIIVGNISVALTHLVSLPLNVATTAKIPLGKATVMTVIEGAVRGIDKAAVITGLQHTLISPLANEPFTSVDGVQSSFLGRRFPSQSIQPTIFDTVQNTLGWLFHLTDQFKSKLTVAGKYYEGIRNGLSKEDAMAEADNYAGRITGDYSVGMKPNVLSAHTTKLIAQFQLGVNDGLSVLMHDIPKWGKTEGDWKKTAWKTGSMFVQFAVFSFLFNQLYMKMRGSGKGIDPIDAGLTLLGLNDEGKGQDFLHRLGLAGGDLAGELPFTSIFTGGFPLASAIGQPLQQIGKGQWGPAVESLLADFTPGVGGGQQVKKSIQGILAYNAGQTTTAAGQTNIPVDKTWLNLMRGIIFGPTGFPGANAAKTETNNLMNMLAASKGTTAKAAEAWYAQYESDKASDPAKALDGWNNLLSSNPKLATEVKKVSDAAKSGITLNERLIKLLGVANGERAQYVYGKYEALPDKPAKDAFWNDYVTKKIISSAVAEQIKALIASGGKAPTGSGKAPDPGTGTAGFEGHPTYFAGSSGPDTDKILGGNSDDGTIKGHNPNNEPIYARDVQLEASRKAEMFAQDPYWKQNGYTMQTTQFDHIIPLEAGGTNTANNTQLISQQSDEQNQPFEDWLGAQYKAGKISRADAAKASIDYKINKSVSFDDVKAGKY